MLEASNPSNEKKPDNKFDIKSNTNGRRVLLLLAVIFVLPFTVAATLHLLDLRPKGHSYGDLIAPPKSLNFTSMKQSDANPDLKIVADKEPQTLEFAQQFGSAINNEGKIYLVDPLGNLMMSYTKEHDPKGLRSDMTRLLKNSWAG